MAASQPPPARPRHPGAARAWLVWWALLAALWLALVDTLAAPEIATGAVAAAIAATGAVLVRSRRRQLLRPRAAWARHAARPVLRMVLDLWPLARVLWHRGIRRAPEGGEMVELPYTAVGDDPRAAAHRVATQALGSLAPNVIVVDVDRERGALLVHRLASAGDLAAQAAPLPDP